jgi:hypothetical protein
VGDMRIYSIGIGLDQSKQAPPRKIKGLSGLLHQILNPDQIDIAFSYITTDYNVSYNQSTNFNSTDFTKMIYNPFAGLTYEMKGTIYIISLKETYFF